MDGGAAAANPVTVATAAAVMNFIVYQLVAIVVCAEGMRSSRRDALSMLEKTTKSQLDVIVPALGTMSETISRSGCRSCYLHQ